MANKQNLAKAIYPFFSFHDFKRCKNIATNVNFSNNIIKWILLSQLQDY
jgi:hypothetical protein